MSERLIDLALQLETLFPTVVERLFLTPDDPLAHMPLVQLKVVRALAGRPSTSSELAARFRMSKPAVSQIVRRLVGSGMVVQHRNGLDGRIKTLDLTPIARRQLDERSRVRAEQATQILSRFSPAELTQLMDLLQRCAAHPQDVDLAS